MQNIKAACDTIRMLQLKLINYRNQVRGVKEDEYSKKYNVRPNRHLS